MDINHNKVVYIHKGEHDNPHGLPQQQDLEVSTGTDHTLYSHTAVRHETDNTLYSHINNDIKYSLFEDVINNYYLDSQIKDDFNCNQECYTEIQQIQQEQQLTPCTHAYDHITQHINNLDDSTQQNTLYTMEEDASLFTSNTTTPCDYNITNGVQNSDTILEGKSKIISPMAIHLQSKHKYRNVFGNSNIQYHDFNNSDALTFEDKYTALLQQELQNPYWCLPDPIMTKSYQVSSEMDVDTMPHAMYFQAVLRQLPKLIMSHTRQ